jgi:5-methyltetrahydropteroyltriglutamate--homocysteine methyltransferase
MAIPATNLGFPRVGPHRELKRVLEGYWAGRLTADELEAAASDLRRERWARQLELGLDHVPSNDFSLYDHVLDTAVMVGAVPDRYRGKSNGVDLDTYFAMARGGELHDRPVAALEMTKWFDTNYHFIVPELAAGQRFEYDGTKALTEFREAAELGITTRPVLLGPISFLVLAKQRDSQTSKIAALLPALVSVYEAVLAELEAAGAQWVQIDEPALCLDLDVEIVDAFGPTYERLVRSAPTISTLVATYFSGLRNNRATAFSLPVAALHLDLISEPSQLDAALDEAPESLALSLGVVDGRNIWRADLDAVLARLERARDRIGSDRLLIAPSCSVLHIPLDLELETDLDPELRSWLSFAVQRLEEVVALACALNDGRSTVEAQFSRSATARSARASSGRVHDLAVQERLAAATPDLEARSAPYGERRMKQVKRLELPLLPTTTIGSFPQTSAVRSLRARHRRGELDDQHYEARMRELVVEAVRFQESVGLDVLVHGEFERNDMVEYFGEHLCGFAVSEHGWVQSYGSRCVKPPLIYGDVSRPAPMTVAWTSYAQSLTDRPVKGILTGPVTILKWSFVRDDQPPETTCRQIALAIRDEVADLEAVGAAIVQIDEPALREGLPLHRDDWTDYLRWAVAAFGIASSGVADETQIHTHMCYADVEDIVGSIVAFDADVISIETSRSEMELLRTFTDVRYPNEIGPGIWDVHSPRVPEVAELVALLDRALDVLSPEQLWVNPDCGLKTRGWTEVEPALRNLVEAARIVRARVGADAPSSVSEEKR